MRLSWFSSSWPPPPARRSGGLSLKQAVQLALHQNPDIVLARLDEQKAAYEVQATKEPMLPARVRGQRGGLFERHADEHRRGVALDSAGQGGAQHLQRAAGLPGGGGAEMARSAALGAAALRKRWRCARRRRFWTLEKAVKARRRRRGQVEHLQRVEAALRLRVEEGRELPIEAKRAAVNLARARAQGGGLRREPGPGSRGRWP